jgi:myo-inositol catabolism protein IolS
MNYRTIKSADITLSEIGLGCWAVGGPNWEKGTTSSGWSPIDPHEVSDAINYAVEHGVTHFDNADCYGDGRAELLLAKSISTKSKDLTISSKVGWIQSRGNHPYHPSNIRFQCEQSLKNISRDVIDIYYFHHGNFGKNDQYLSDAIETMHQLRDEGKIRAIGLSTYSQKEFKRLIPTIRPDVVQCWAHLMDYHFIAKNSQLQQLCDTYNSTIIGFQPLNQGLLLGKYDKNTPPSFGDGDHRASLKKFSKESIGDVNERLSQMAKRYDHSTETFAAVAFQFVLAHQNITGIVAGFRNLEQVKTNLSKPELKLNGEDLRFLYKLFQK